MTVSMVIHKFVELEQERILQNLAFYLNASKIDVIVSFLVDLPC